tara:strand:+ start:1958 stop:2485 length:528 start_codon:yes stop_codon:yes gene_type:complete
LRLSLDEASTINFIDDLEAELENGVEQLNEWRSRRGEKTLTSKQLTKRAPLPWAEELDDDAKPTGNMLIKTKLKAERKLKGNVVSQRPMVFDGEGNPFPVDTPVWSGSVVSLAVDPFPYYVPSIGYGVTLQLRGVQVHKVVNGENQDSPEAFGFVVAESEIREVSENEVLAAEEF